ncbi:MAG: OmpA family protein, partial [Bacteroidota bacterium]
SQGMRLRIENLHFYPGRSRLVPQSIPQLKALEKLLQQHPTLTIKIDGHVCCLLQDTLSPIQPSDGYDRDFNTNNLSVTRAQNIYNYLIRKGIDQGRLSYEGHGIKRPLIQPEITSEDEQLNRRVEIVITGF